MLGYSDMGHSNLRSVKKDTRSRVSTPQKYERAPGSTPKIGARSLNQDCRKFSRGKCGKIHA